MGTRNCTYFLTQSGSFQDEIALYRHHDGGPSWTGLDIIHFLVRNRQVKSRTGSLARWSAPETLVKLARWFGSEYECFPNFTDDSEPYHPVDFLGSFSTKMHQIEPGDINYRYLVYIDEFVKIDFGSLGEAVIPYVELHTGVTHKQNSEGDTQYIHTKKPPEEWIPKHYELRLPECLSPRYRAWRASQEVDHIDIPDFENPDDWEAERLESWCRADVRERDYNNTIEVQP